MPLAATHVCAVDLAKVFRKQGGDFSYLTTIAWGDPVHVLDIGTDDVVVAASTIRVEDDGSPRAETVEGFIRIPKGVSVRADEVVTPLANSRVLKVDFVDVQQGDAAVIETPRGGVVLVDGGANQLFARYLTNRFWGSSPAEPKDVAAVVITHGDADHFSGLTQIRRSEDHPASFKRLFLRPQRIYHNGLAKRPSASGGTRISWAPRQSITGRPTSQISTTTS